MPNVQIPVGPNGPYVTFGASTAADGAMLDLSNIATINSSTGIYGSIDGGYPFVTTAATAITLTALGNLVERLTAAGAVTVTFDSAYNIVNTLAQSQPINSLALVNQLPFANPQTQSNILNLLPPLLPALGEVFSFNIVSTGAATVATPTLSDTAVTLAGTTSVLAGALRWYRAVITQLFSTVAATFTAGTTFTSLTEIGATNNYTLAVGTNTIVPVVGTLVFLNVTAGTLPSGWYPINAESSATSFVIAAPAGTVWTMTAGTIGTATVAPLTYSPLITITGIMSTVTAIMTV